MEAASRKKMKKKREIVGKMRGIRRKMGKGSRRVSEVDGQWPRTQTTGKSC